MGRKIIEIEIQNITKSFYADGKPIKIIDDFSYLFNNKIITSIIGPNGSGKTTLLNLISGLYDVENGNINFNRYESQKRLGYLMQNYRDTLFPWYNVIDNITFPLKLQGINKKKRNRLGEEVLKKYLNNIDSNAKVYELSGGQQQILCHLRNFIINPDILLLDEPLSALDRDNTFKMLGYLQDYILTNKCVTIIVTHDIDEAIFLSDNVLLISNGKIIDQFSNSRNRPREMESLYSQEHINIRNMIFESLLKNI